MPALTFSQEQDARIFAESVINTVREALLVLDGQLRVISANNAFYEVFKVSEAETAGRLIYELGNGQWNIPKLRELLETIIPRNTRFQGYEVEHAFPAIGDKVMLLNARRINQEGGRQQLILLAIEDITDRIRARRALEDSEAKYHKFVENLNSIIIGFDAAGRITFFNHFAEKLFGYRREEVLGKEFVGTIIPRRESTGKDNSGLVADTVRHPEKHYFNINEGLRKNGDRIWFSWSAGEVRDRNGDIAEILIDGNDLTTERERQRLAEEAYNLLENTLDLAVRFDADKRYVFANKAAAELVRRPREQILGKTLGELGSPPRTAEILNRAFEDALRTKRPQKFESKYGDRYFETLMVPELGEKGDVVSFMMFARENTEAKKAEEALRASKDFTDKLLATSLTGLYIYDGKKQIITFINAQYTRLTGYSLEELTELSQQGSFFDFFHPDDRERVLTYAGAMGNIRENETREVEYRFRRKDGDWRWFLSRETLFSRNPDGTLHEYVGSFIDITERKKTEQELQESRSSLLRAQAIAHIGSWKLDLKTSIASCSDEFFRILGITRPEVYTYTDFEKSVYPDDRAIPSDAIEEIVRSKRNVTAEFRIVRPDGEVRYIHAEGDLSVENGKDITYGTFQDITERNRVEQALRENREDLNRAQAVGRIGSWRLNTRRNELLWSDEAYAIFDVPRGTPLTYETFLSFIHPDDRKYVDRKWKAALQGEPYDIEHRIIVGSETKWVREKAELVSDQQGTLFGGFGIVQDITDRKKGEEALIQARDTAERLAAEAEEGRRILFSIMRNIKEGITIADAPDGKIRMVSDYGLELIGKPKEELVGIPAELRPEKWGFYGKDGKTLAKPEELPLYRVMKNGETVTGEEWLIKCPDGNIRTFSFSAAPVRDADNTIIGAVSGWRDVTEARKAEEAMRRNEYELRTLVDNSPDLIFRLNRQMQYVYANPAYERLTGILRDQFIGKTNRELGMPPRLIEFWQTSIGAAMESGREHSLEFDISGFFGKRYFSARLIPEFEKSGLVETVLVIARDITERKHAEEQIRYISFHDEVTGLFNRAFFEEELHRVDTGRDLPVSIIMGDVNNLKLSNDVFGHEEGDKLLEAIADIFRKACRKNDIIARWGGDEFAVILPKTDFDTAAEVCRRVKQAATESKGTVIQPGVALGVATKDNRDQNIYQTIRQAEERMYNNKLEESKKNEDIVYSSLFECAREKNIDLDAHIERSNALADAFGRELSLSESQRDDLRLLIKLHDIGDAVIPGEILKKPGRLTPAEWEIVKKHSEAGLRIVKTYMDTARVSDEVFSHGERWDGTGYPRGLKEKEIPYLARVFQVIDVFDVITHPRPYARTLTRDEAVQALRRNAGRQFDPELTEIFLRMLTKGSAAAVR